MNHTEAVTARRVTEYNHLIRLVQESQRAYAAVKVEEVEGTARTHGQASDEYHYVDQLVRRSAATALGITELEIKGGP